MALYGEEFPRWRLDDHQRVVLENAAAVPRHQRWTRQLTEAGEEATALQREMVERGKARLAGPAARRVAPGASGAR